MNRVGIGYDLHKLVDGRRLILGGVHVPYSMGLLGHSDADVLVHAVIDALLGAAALGNIGQLFPDTDPLYTNADSIELLKVTVKRLQEAGYQIVNVDANIIAQKPKLSPYLDAMRQRLASAMDIAHDRVSVKAKTNESVGPEGRGEAISAQAVVLIRMKDEG